MTARDWSITVSARTCAVIALAIVTLAILVTGAGLSSTPATAAPASVPPSNGHEFDAPSGIAYAAEHIWVTNRAGNSVTEIDPTNGAWLHTFHGTPYSFDAPDAVIADGAVLFVANAAGSITELGAGSGNAITVLTGSQYGFSDPVALARSGGTILVVNAGNPTSKGSVTEIDAATGAVERVASGPTYGFDSPDAVAADSGNAFVSDRASNGVTEINVATGHLVAHVAGSGLDRPDGIGISSGHVWVADSASNGVTELEESPLSVTRSFNDSDGSYGFGQPSVTVTYAGYAFVITPYGSSPMVTKLSATTGVPSWYMCNTNGPYYFSNLSAMAVAGTNMWVVSHNGANNPNSAAATGSLTELETGSGALLRTIPT
jgi:hypothetical protein